MCERMSSPEHNAKSEVKAEPLGGLQHALHRVLKSLIFRGEPVPPLNEMPIAQLRCLHVIAYEEGQKMQEVAQKLELKLPAVSQIVERLVKRGMVERRPDPNDRRVVRLALTELARGILA